MNLEPAPRLPKWIFLAIDAGLLLIAFVIVYFAKDPYAPLPFVSAVLCAALAAVIGLVPFLIDFAADTAEAVQRERERINDQVARLHAATESLARAAAQIKAVEEAVHKSARDAETLPYRMQEKLAEFNETLAAKEESDREALETELEQLRATNSDQLKSTAEKISKAAADWSALEVATRKQLAAAEAALAKLQSGSGDAATEFQAKVATALKDLDTRIANLKHAADSVPTTISVAAAPAPVAAPAPTAPVAAVYDRRNEAAAAPDGGHRRPLQDEAKAAAPVEVASTGAALPPATAPEISASAPAADVPATEVAPGAEPPKPKKPRAPRKPKAEDTLLAMSSESVPGAAANGAEHPAVAESQPVSALESAPAEPIAPAASDEPAPESSSAVESSSSSDGATRLLATAYIGIGNKLFIRGDGPGLSWDSGVPMQFVSIGKWGWSTHDAAGPVRCKLYKNDDLASLTGEITLEAGRHTEVTALF